MEQFYCRRSTLQLISQAVYLFYGLAKFTGVHKQNNIQANSAQDVQRALRIQKKINKAMNDKVQSTCVQFSWNRENCDLENTALEYLRNCERAKIILRMR